MFIPEMNSQILNGNLENGDRDMLESTSSSFLHHCRFRCCWITITFEFVGSVTKSTLIYNLMLRM